ncbi:MAG TPA: UDP-3-O-(3-hydroxymyristoyl)glucosamine N-acyltransferase, partial [Thermoleophilia bacterium]|nr:UDP-3-O-(3-hydroxymyristoyl)glucosamine N-acyltransferase [Thermoleophilia bacterium]
GSTKLGTGVVAGGQAGIAGHLTVEDGARLAAQCGIMSDVETGVTLMGSPAMQLREYLRVEVAMRRLPELMKRVRELEKKLEGLEGRS